MAKSRNSNPELLRIPSILIIMRAHLSILSQLREANYPFLNGLIADWGGIGVTMWGILPYTTKGIGLSTFMFPYLYIPMTYLRWYRSDLERSRLMAWALTLGGPFVSPLAMRYEEYLSVRSPTVLTLGICLRCARLFHPKMDGIKLP